MRITITLYLIVTEASASDVQLFTVIQAVHDLFDRADLVVQLSRDGWEGMLQINVHITSTTAVKNFWLRHWLELVYACMVLLITYRSLC